MTYNSLWSIDGFDLDIDPSEFYEQCRNLDYPTDAFSSLANSFCNVRGRHPSRGFVLATADLLSKIAGVAPLRSPVHTLRISDGNTEFTFPKLAIVRTLGITVGTADHNNKPFPTSPFLVELADARIYANWSAIRSRTSVRQPNQLPDPNLGYQTIFDQLWASVSGVLGRVADRSTYPNGLPSNLYQDQTAGWDSVLSFLDFMGHTIFPSDGGFICDDIKNEPDKGLLRIFEDNHGRLIDTDPDPVKSLAVPANIRINVFSLDAQYQFNPGNHVSFQDLWRDNPGRSFDFAIAGLAPALAKFAIPGTTFTVWVPFDYQKDDRNQDNIRKVTEFAKSHAQQIVQPLSQYWSNSSRTYSGIVPVRPGNYLSAVTFYDTPSDHLPGIKTKPAVLPYNFNPAVHHPITHEGLTLDFAPTPGREWIAPPDNARHHVPHERLIVCKLPKPASTGSASGDPDKDSLSCQILKPGQPFNPRRYGLPHKEKAFFNLYYHQEANKKLEPIPFSTIEAYNVMGTLIPWDTWCLARFNYQPGEHPAGRWNIVSIAPIFVTWQADCLPSEEITETKCTLFPNLVTVRKNSGLRLVKRVKPFDAEKEGIREVIIDLKGGPTNSVAIGQGLDKPLAYSSAPTLSQVTLTGGLRFLKGNLASLLLPPKEGKIKLRLPNDDNAAPGSILVAKTPGPCVETEWLKPGIDTVVSFSGWAGESCSGTSSCITLYFTRGILTKTKGLPTSPTTTSPIKGTDCPLPILPNFEHCLTPTPPPKTPSPGDLIQ